MNKPENKYFNKALDKAGQLINDNERLGSLAKSALAKIKKARASGKSSEVFEKVSLFIRLIRNYVSGTYRKIPAKSFCVPDK